VDPLHVGRDVGADEAGAGAEVHDAQLGRQRDPGAQRGADAGGELRGDGAGVPVLGLVVEQIGRRGAHRARVGGAAGAVDPR
jgi:hypothetical protein